MKKMLIFSLKKEKKREKSSSPNPTQKPKLLIRAKIWNPFYFLRGVKFIPSHGDLNLKPEDSLHLLNPCLNPFISTDLHRTSRCCCCCCCCLWGPIPEYPVILFPKFFFRINECAEHKLLIWELKRPSRIRTCGNSLWMTDRLFYFTVWQDK